MKCVWDTTTGENIHFAETYDECLAFIKKSGNPNYKITSCD